MNKTRSQTIRIFFPNGNPRSIRKVERTSNSNIRLLEIPRRELESFYAMPEAAGMGIYFLAGEQQLYIGQTAELGNRIRQHDKSKLFWQQVFVVVLNNDFRTLDHLYCLEKTAIEHAQAAGRFSLENGTAGNKQNHLNDSIRSDCENIFEEIETLLAVLNQDFFANQVQQTANYSDGLAHRPQPDRPSENTANPSVLPPLYIKGKGGTVTAQGIYDGNAFTLLKGSLLVKEDAAYFNGRLNQIKTAWLEQGILTEYDADHWQLAGNQQFATPSRAADLVVGKSRNGWTRWKTADGTTLDELFRNPKS